MIIFGESYHAFSIRYSDTFYQVLAAFLTQSNPDVPEGTFVVRPDGLGVTNSILYDEHVSNQAFVIVNRLFSEAGLIDDATTDLGTTTVTAASNATVTVTS